MPLAEASPKRTVILAEYFLASRAKREAALPLSPEAFSSFAVMECMGYLSVLRGFLFKTRIYVFLSVCKQMPSGTGKVVYFAER